MISEVGVEPCDITEDFTWLFNAVKGNPEKFRAYFKTATYSITGDYKITFFVNGLHAIITTWLDNDCADPAEQMNEIVMREYRKFHDIDF